MIYLIFALICVMYIRWVLFHLTNWEVKANREKMRKYKSSEICSNLAGTGSNVSWLNAMHFAGHGLRCKITHLTKAIVNDNKRSRIQRRKAEQRGGHLNTLTASAAGSPLTALRCHCTHSITIDYMSQLFLFVVGSWNWGKLNDN